MAEMGINLSQRCSARITRMVPDLDRITMDDAYQVEGQVVVGGHLHSRSGHDSTLPGCASLQPAMSMAGEKSCSQRRPKVGARFVSLAHSSGRVPSRVGPEFAADRRVAD